MMFFKWKSTEKKNIVHLILDLVQSLQYDVKISI